MVQIVNKSFLSKLSFFSRRCSLQKKSARAVRERKMLSSASRPSCRLRCSGALAANGGKDNDDALKKATSKTTATTKRRDVLKKLALATSTTTTSATLFTLFGVGRSDAFDISATSSSTSIRYAYEINAKKRLLETQRLYALQPEVEKDDTEQRFDGSRRRDGGGSYDVDVDYVDDDIIEIPMTFDGASFVVDYYIGEASVRGVVDTGSPFITIQGGNGSENWGFVTKSDIRPSPYGETYEVYGLQVDSSTVWCLGDLRFTTSRDFATTTTVKSNVKYWGLREMVLGVVNGSMANVGGSINGANASFVGLTKYRQDWIRPTFLEQTDVSSFSMNFEKETLTLSRKNLIDKENDANVLPMIDLRPLGAPVYHYAVLLDDLYINGEKHKFKNKNEKTYVIFDSGTTGLLVSKDLYENSAFRDGAFQAAMTFTDIKGKKSSVAIGSSIRTCTRKCLFLCLPLKVPWDGVLEEKSNVIFAGLAVLMNQGEMTVDCEEGLLRLKSDPGVSRTEFEADEEGFIPIRTRGRMASDIKLYNET